MAARREILPAPKQQAVQVGPARVEVNNWKRLQSERHSALPPNDDVRTAPPPPGFADDQPAEPGGHRAARRPYDGRLRPPVASPIRHLAGLPSERALRRDAAD